MRVLFVFLAVQGAGSLTSLKQTLTYVCSTLYIYIYDFGTDFDASAL